MYFPTLAPEKEISHGIIRDRLQRPLRDLRISVIDRCNFRCPYCMPAEHFPDSYQFLDKKEWLSFDEIVRLTRLFVSLGVSKVRITGGEPLLRPDITDLIEQISRIEGVEDLALTTNGFYLEKFTADLKKVGLKRLTVSLDTLDEKTFQEMNGQRGSLNTVLKGLKAAEQAGFSPIKLNVVVQRGVNDQQLLDIVERFKGKNHIIRFLEYMDVGNRNHWQPGKVLPSEKILKIITARYPLKPLEPNYTGEVATRYQFQDGSGEIGFVSSISQPFCGTCNRARLSANGKLYTCLFASEGHDLRSGLRIGQSDEDLLNRMKTLWQKREDRYSELRFNTKIQIQKRPKIEMYQIGG